MLYCSDNGVAWADKKNHKTVILSFVFHSKQVMDSAKKTRGEPLGADEGVTEQEISQTQKVPEEKHVSADDVNANAETLDTYDESKGVSGRAGSVSKK